LSIARRSISIENVFDVLNAILYSYKLIKGEGLTVGPSRMYYDITR